MALSHIPPLQSVGLVQLRKHRHNRPSQICRHGNDDNCMKSICQEPANDVSSNNVIGEFSFITVVYLQPTEGIQYCTDRSWCRIRRLNGRTLPDKNRLSTNIHVPQSHRPNNAPIIVLGTTYDSEQGCKFSSRRSGGNPVRVAPFAFNISNEWSSVGSALGNICSRIEKLCKFSSRSNFARPKPGTRTRNSSYHAFALSNGVHVSPSRQVNPPPPASRRLDYIPTTRRGHIPETTEARNYCLVGRTDIKELYRPVAPSSLSSGSTQLVRKPRQDSTQ